MFIGITELFTRFSGFSKPTSFTRFNSFDRLDSSMFTSFTEFTGFTHLGVYPISMSQDVLVYFEQSRSARAITCIFNGGTSTEFVSTWLMLQACWLEIFLFLYRDICLGLPGLLSMCKWSISLIKSSVFVRTLSVFLMACSDIFCFFIGLFIWGYLLPSSFSVCAQPLSNTLRLKHKPDTEF